MASSEQSVSVGILGTGSYVPEKILTNKDLEALVDTTDEWILTRTGMKERRIAAPGETTSNMGAEAGRKAVEAAGLAPEDIGAIITATATPDMMFPNTSCLVQNKIGCGNAFCFDVSAACSGFLYGIEVARGLIVSGQVKYALVIGSEKMSGVLDWTDRGTCVLFGDAAGAVVMGACGEGVGILHSVHGSDGALGDLLTLGTAAETDDGDDEKDANNGPFIRMKGREVFKHAVTRMAEAAGNALAAGGLGIDDVNCIIPHQANDRIIKAIGDRIGAGEEKFFLNVDKYGNTSAASVGVALDEAVRSGRVKSGDLVLFVVFGSGFTWGSTTVRWI